MNETKPSENSEKLEAEEKRLASLEKAPSIVKDADWQILQDTIDKQAGEISVIISKFIDRRVRPAYEAGGYSSEFDKERAIDYHVSRLVASSTAIFIGKHIFDVWCRHPSFTGKSSKYFVTGLWGRLMNKFVVKIFNALYKERLKEVSDKAAKRQVTVNGINYPVH